jgi:hypothetical protein
MNTLPPIQIFKAGQYTASNGSVFAFSDADIAATVASYKPELSEAPLVVGHPAIDAPAYGWVSALQFADGVLSALPTDVDAGFAELVNSRRFSKVSAAFYAPDAPNNPVQGVYYLRHVGFLGAQPPAVKGLRSPQFAGDDELVICFDCAVPSLVLDSSIDAGMTIPTTGDVSMLTPEEIAAKQAEVEKEKAQVEEDKKSLAAQQVAFAEQQSQFQVQLAKQKAAEIDAVVDGLVKDGRLLPKHKAGLVAFMSSDKPGDVIEFAEGDTVVKTVGNDWLLGFLKDLPKQVEFSEVASGAGTNSKPVDNKAIARRAQAYKAAMDAQGVNLSFAEAVDGVLANEDKAGV